MATKPDYSPHNFYGWEKFHLAILTLVGPEEQRQRLVNAYRDNIIHLRPENVPEEIRAELAQFKTDMDRVSPKGDEGSAQATVDAMSDEDVDRMCDRIVSMHDIVTRHEPRD